MLADLDGNWAVLAEAIQTVLRKYGVEDAYEQIKLATQNRDMDAAAIRQIVEAAAIDDADRQRLLSLTPAGFVGLAREIASDALGAGPGR
jgi:adenylosuccinate lyase